MELWYSKYDLDDRFNINIHTMNRFIKGGILKPRIIPSPAGRVHKHIFLIKDNKDTLPPKKLTELRSVKITEDGKECIRSYPWYKFEDPNIALKDYKIMDHLRVMNREGVK